MKVLVIEDSERLLRSLGHGLKKEGYSVDLVADGQDGLDYALYNDYDLVVLDLMLPNVDGLTILREMRKKGKQAGVLILSAKDEVEDRITGLQLGADDYMIKPFSFEELCARLHTLTRRRFEEKSPELEVGPVQLNTSTRGVKRSGEAVNLTPGEYAILEYLVMHRGRVISKDQLLEAMHDSDTFSGANVIEVMVCNLRKKIGNGNGDGTTIVQTKRGHGYLVE